MDCQVRNVLYREFESVAQKKGKYDMRGISVQTVHPPKMSKISKFGGWPWDRYGILEGA